MSDSRMVFAAVLTITMCSAVIAFVIAIIPLFFVNASSATLLEPLFTTCTYLFSSGVGAIFGLLGSSK